ncbi:DUF2986 domain-containing protein [Paraglaciecola aestuariivivens]
MNRRKKGNQILKARAKKAKAKLSGKRKPKYISKAERAQMTEQPESNNESNLSAENASPAS